MIKSFFSKFFNISAICAAKYSPILNRLYFNLKNVHFGRNLNVFGNVYIIGNGSITIGDNFCMTSGHAINPICSNLRGVFYTENENSKIHIGNNVGMSSTRMWIHDNLTIGNNVKIGACVLLIDTDTHPIDYHVRRTSGLGTKSSPIFIDDDVWIGAHTIVLKGVTIGARSIIGAGSVVTKSIPADCIAAGNPCTVIKKI